MNASKLVIGIALAALASAADTQGTPIPEELLAKTRAANEAIQRGKDALANNRLADAIEEFKIATQIEDTFGFPVSEGNYELAKALTVAGRAQEALTAYRRALLWNSVRKDYEVVGPPTPLVAFDYAILLAKSGRAKEAKSLYYFGLRTYNPFAEAAFEPIPFLVVFDPDAKMTVWEYTPENLIAAATMAKAPWAGPKAIALAKEAQRLKPDWALPTVYLATLAPKRERKELLDRAAKLALTNEEKGWIEAWDESRKEQPVGWARRKASKVLEQARQNEDARHPQGDAGHEVSGD